jgi:hypothetical protein
MTRPIKTVEVDPFGGAVSDMDYGFPWLCSMKDRHSAFGNPLPFQSKRERGQIRWRRIT